MHVRYCLVVSQRDVLQGNNYAYYGILFLDFYPFVALSNSRNLEDFNFSLIFFLVSRTIDHTEISKESSFRPIL